LSYLPTKDEKDGKCDKKGKKKWKPCPEKEAWMKKPPPEAKKNKPKMVNDKTYGGALSTTTGEVTRSTSVKVGDWKRRHKIQKLQH